MNTMFGYTLPISLTANQRADFQLNIDADSDFIVERVMSKEDGSFRLQVLDSTSSYRWFSDRIRGENFFGDAEYPNELPIPIALKRSTQLLLDIEDLSGAPNNIELVFEGYRVYDQQVEVGRKRYFAYVKNFTMAANDRTLDTLITDADADFLVQRAIAYRSKAYAVQAKMSMSALAGRQLYSQFTYVENIFGSVLRPNNLRHPLRLDKNSLIKYEIANLDAAPQTVQLVFDGTKIWS